MTGSLTATGCRTACSEHEPSRGGGQGGRWGAHGAADLGDPSAWPHTAWPGTSRMAGPAAAARPRSGWSSPQLLGQQARAGARACAGSIVSRNTLGHLGVGPQRGQEAEHRLGAVAADVLGHLRRRNACTSARGSPVTTNCSVACAHSRRARTSVLLGGPPAVDRGQADAGPVGHVLHAELVVALRRGAPRAPRRGCRSLRSSESPPTSLGHGPSPMPPPYTGKANSWNISYR